MGELLFQEILLVVVFVAYNYCIFEFGDTFLKNARLKKMLRIPVGLVNTVFALGFTLLPRSTSMLSYACVCVIIFVEFCLFYKDKLLRIMTLVLSFFLHIMMLRSISVSVFSLILKRPIHELVADRFWLIATMNVCFLVLCLMLLGVAKLLPKDKANIIAEHDAQLVFVISWSGLASLYFLFNARVYSIALPFQYVVLNQLAVSLTVLCGYYVVLFFSIKVGESVQIKEKNLRLEKVVETEQRFRNSVTSDALMVYEVNLSRDLLTRGFENRAEELEEYHHQFSKLLYAFAPSMVCADDLQAFIEFSMPDRVLQEYAAGKTELEYEYRRRTGTGNLHWVRAICNLYQDKESGDIKALVYIKDIHEEKLMELELIRKAERDSLTGLYNKGMCEKLVSAYLSEIQESPQKGALFMIDVDNFKSVNDKLGHAFGDVVLCELSEKLRNIFRSAEETVANVEQDDIIGRVGGDEFLVFMKNAPSRRVLQAKAEKVRKAFLNRYQSAEKAEIVISSSIGIAVSPKNGESYEELYKGADIALYKAKNEGKNAYAFYSGEAFSGYESKRGVIDSTGETGQNMPPPKKPE